MAAILATAEEINILGTWILCFTLVIAAIVVVVLQIYGITRGALQIDEYLDGIIGTLRRILANTNPLFDLEKTARLGEELRSTVGAIEQDAKVVLEHAAAGPRGPRGRALA